VLNLKYWLSSMIAARPIEQNSDRFYFVLEQCLAIVLLSSDHVVQSSLH